MKKDSSSTRHGRIATYLLSLGYTEEEYNSRKYRKFTHPDRTHPLWLGKAGAIRSGRIATDTINAERIIPARILTGKDS
jgi:hypothetical protein